MAESGFLGGYRGFFEQLGSFLDSSRAHVDTASEDYCEFTVELLATCVVNLERVLSVFQSASGEEGRSFTEDELIYCFTDGHHKLVRWRLVTHCGIDGFSRMIVYCKCSSNNKASTVYELFLKATRQFGLPSRVRSDHGRENILVAQHMLEHRGSGRGSMITGSSTHNQRIERLWRDLHRCVTQLFYRLFYHLENIGLLDPLNEAHLYCVHYVFVPRINRALEAFQKGWNHHSIRTENNKSPHQLFVQGYLSLQRSGLVALDFAEQVDTNYGIEEHGLATLESQVEVPQSLLTVPESALEQLRQQVNPLRSSDNYGIELYEEALRFITNFM